MKKKTGTKGGSRPQEDMARIAYSLGKAMGLLSRLVAGKTATKAELADAYIRLNMVAAFFMESDWKPWRRARKPRR